MPYGILGVSLLTALMPRMSRAAARGDRDRRAGRPVAGQPAVRAGAAAGHRRCSWCSARRSARSSSATAAPSATAGPHHRRGAGGLRLRAGAVRDHHAAAAGLLRGEGRPHADADQPRHGGRQGGAVAWSPRAVLPTGTWSPGSRWPPACRTCWARCSARCCCAGASARSAPPGCCGPAPASWSVRARRARRLAVLVLVTSGSAWARRLAVAVVLGSLGRARRLLVLTAGAGGPPSWTTCCVACAAVPPRKRQGGTGPDGSERPATVTSRSHPVTAGTSYAEPRQVPARDVPPARGRRRPGARGSEEGQ